MKIHNKPSTEINNQTIDFTPPYRRIDVTEELTKQLGELPNLNDGRYFICFLFFVESSIPQLMEICKKHQIDVSKPITLPRVLDALIGYFIEPQCIQPTFIINHPMVMSPLSKEHEHSGKSERFELFVNGVEIINAYTEQNDPLVYFSIFLIIE